MLWLGDAVYLRILPLIGVVQMASLNVTTRAGWTAAEVVGTDPAL